MNDDGKTDECCSGNCDCSGRVTRREVLKQGAVAAGAIAASSYMAESFAGPFGSAADVDHFIPIDKKLSPEWVKMLFSPGERTWYEGDDLLTIGLPVGGICAGQVYLTGEGTLVYWDIFNSNHNTGYGLVNYKEGRKPTEVAAGREFIEAREIEHGFDLRVQVGDKADNRPLTREGFKQVRFAGEYPLGMVEYRDDESPIEVTQTAFSPFIPLETEDSALPCVVQQFQLRNSGSQAAKVKLTGRLANAILRDHLEECVGRASRVNRAFRSESCEGVQCAATVIERPTQPRREPILFADFEGEDYGEWRVEGESFGHRPAGGTLESQNPVSGYKGEGLVNTYRGGSDQQTGKLTSPPFTIERPWIGFLIGGGAHEGSTCINLVVEGKVVHSAAGKNSERLAPRNWNVEEYLGKQAHLEILDEETGHWGHINIDQIEFRDEPMPSDVAEVRRLRDFGTMSLAIVDPVSARMTPSQVQDAAASRYALADLGERLVGAVSEEVTLKPGEERTVTFVTTWHFPNQYRRQPWGDEPLDALVGQYYAKRFENAAGVARYVALNFERLAKATRQWHEVYYDSTLPRWLLDRCGATTCNLATTTCQWWRDGRFWAWEGCGCCHGTCGHVWNYAHGLARLFPELERSAREMQDFAPGVGFDPETGAIGFRGEGWGHWAGDSQAGYILKALREHQCSTDDGFLNRNWRNIKKAMQFLIDQDADSDGIIEGKQHNTYDIDYYGANTMVGSLYLGALRAAEEMAGAVGDERFAEDCRRLFEVGQEQSVERLFNGEYFIQDVDLEKHPDWQYKDGCLADQLFGQSWAHQVGLGHVYPKETVHQALEAIWKYCWAPDVNRQNQAHPPERWFARPGEAGLLTCTWPVSRHLGPRSTRYRDEVWTGIEYQVASHMAWEGMLTEALAICRAVHDRYHPSKRNPFNEVECGDHYARALASWGVLTGLAGFEYDGPSGSIGFAPRLTPEHFKSVFTAAAGWGTYEQKRQAKRQDHTLHLAHGELSLRRLRLALKKGVKLGRILVSLGDQIVPVEHGQEDERVVIEFATGIKLAEGHTLSITLHHV
jgi:uncharacterized protein (DUF608 family)